MDTQILKVDIIKVDKICGTYFYENLIHENSSHKIKNNQKLYVI